MWEPAFDAVSKRRGRSCLGLSTVGPARHFHSELMDSAHFGEKRPSGTPQEQKRSLSKKPRRLDFLTDCCAEPKMVRFLTSTSRATPTSEGRKHKGPSAERHDIQLSKPCPVRGYLNFNGTTSTVDVVTSLDSLGRVQYTQQKQTPARRPTIQCNKRMVRSVAPISAVPLTQEQRPRLLQGELVVSRPTRGARESLVGDRQFWITRPYEWKKLLTAKALSAPAELGISPIKLFRSRLFPLVQDERGFTARLCPGTPVRSPYLRRSGAPQSELAIDGLRLADYQLMDSRQGATGIGIAVP